MKDLIAVTIWCSTIEGEWIRDFQVLPRIGEIICFCPKSGGVAIQARVKAVIHDIPKSRIVLQCDSGHDAKLK